MKNAHLDQTLQQIILRGGQIYDCSELDCYNCAVHRDVHTTLTTKNNQELLRYEGIDEDMRLRLRRLTERESFRLMGVRDSDTDKIQAYEEPGVKKSQISSTAQYALAGNSIVVDVLAALMEQMFYPVVDSDLLF